MTASISKEQRTRGEAYEAPPPVPRAARTRGRPSDFEPDFVHQAGALAAQGYDMQEIADELGVSRPTVWAWRYRYPEFSNAINTGRNIADDRVEEALERTAREGNTTAQIFWLKNRRPAKWRDRQEHELIVPDTSDAPERSTKELALEMLGMLNDAVYAPDTPVEQLPKTLDLTANAREETEHDTIRRGRVTGEHAVAADPGFDFDLDPGEL